MQLLAGDHASRSHESLQPVVRELVRRHIAIFLALWITMAIPISCDHHAQMGLLDLERAGHYGDLADAGAAHEHGDQQRTDVECSLQDHPISPSAAMTLSLFVGALPIHTFIPQEVISSPVSSVRDALPLQLALSPPDQPPRSY
jgi:hypothetical protein